jgi:hypothetical protein
MRFCKSMYTDCALKKFSVYFCRLFALSFSVTFCESGLQINSGSASLRDRKLLDFTC